MEAQWIQGEWTKEEAKYCRRYEGDERNTRERLVKGENERMEGLDKRRYRGLVL